MKYRILGRTKLKVSEIGLRGHEYRRFLSSTLNKREKIDEEKIIATQPMRNEIVRKAVEAGINYFDTTFIEEVKSLGAALKSLKIERRKIHIAAMIISPFRKMSKQPKSKWIDIIKTK